jgi:hypothetical protein
MMMNETRSRALAFVLMMSAPLVGCGAERPAVGAATTSSTPTPAANASATAASVAKATVSSDVTVFSDGSIEIGPRITNVAMLKLLPNGTYARTCGAPDPEARAMMEGVMRTRMGSRR